jgi:peptidyl-tRNA hydrolase
MPPGEKMAEFVLSSFLPSEMKAVREMIQRAADAVIEFAESGISRAMNRFNARPDPETVT